MSSSYLLVICMLALQLAGQVSCVVEFVCDVQGDSFCNKEHDMNQERYDEDVSQDPANIVYTLNVNDTDDATATFKFEIVVTSGGNMPPGVANGIDFMAIDESTGDVTFHTPIDFEEYKEIRPTWLITSSSGAILSRYVRVYIENVNDIFPQFNYQPYVSDPIPENTTIGTIVFSNVNVTDGDDDDNPKVDGPIEFSLLDSLQSNGCDNSTFQIDPGSGDLILNENVNYLGITQYTVCIQADDQGTNRGPLKSSTTVRLSISDVQGEAPNFFGIPYRVSVPENTTVNTTIFENIFAADGDTGVPNPNPVFITLLGGGYDRFRVSSEFADKAVLIINQALDREINDSYTLEIQAREADGSQPDENIVTKTLIDVTVLDVNDEAPEFSSLPDPVYLLENSPTNTPLNLGVTVTDADTAPNARFQLSLQGEGAEPFALLEKEFTGVGTVDIRVSNRELLDYEKAERFEFEVVASEEGHADVGFDVTVFLEDVNDNSPKFEKEIYDCEVFENSVGGTPICQLTATDLDRSPEFANITYQLEGSGSDRFVIDLLEGNVTVATDVTLDAETQDVFFLTVLANNGDRVSTTLLQINLMDMNDVSPVFNLGPNEEPIPIQEFDNPDLIGKSLVVISASDGDITAENKEVTYLISSGNDDGKFSIDDKSGEISLNDTIDYELEAQQYNLLVVARNTKEPFLEGEANVTVTILDINDNAPVFPEDNYQVNVSEDAGFDFNVIMLNATDADQPDDPNSRIDYRILSGSQDQFRIEVNTGIIHVNDVLNREAVDYYSLEVVATDRGIDQLQGSCMVLINITDVNDVDPVFEAIEPQPFRVDEDYPTGYSSIFYPLTADDPDLNADLRYFIDSEDILVYNENGDELMNTKYMYQFGIVETTGGIYVNQSLDREEAAMFMLPLIVEDFAAPDPVTNPQIDTISMQITIEDVNDNTPVFLNTPYNFDVDESEENGTVISASISATDPDFGNNGQIRYYKDSGPGFNYVKINEETGVLTVAGNFDHEKLPLLEVYVRAEDLGTPQRSVIAPVSLHVMDINDNPPVFNSSIPGEIHLAEDVDIGTKVVKVTATDLDTDHAELTFAITAGNNAGKFGIDAITGVITVKAALDRETTGSYDLSVVASDKAPDQQPQQDNIEITILILDVNDKVPQITNPEFEDGTEFPETVEPGYSVLFVNAEDADEDGSVNEQIRFYLGEGVGSELFAINEFVGQITTTQPLNSLSAEYDLVVIARDQGEPPLESNRTLHINVLDVNNDIPEILFPKQDDIIYINEGHGPAAFVLKIEAIDNDKGLNGRITYEWYTPGYPDYQQFTLDNETGTIDINEVADREERQSYDLNIRVANRFSGSQEDSVSSPVQFTIVVNDTNDNEPVFRDPTEVPAPLPLDVGENLEPGEEVGSVNVASDDDAPGNDIIFYFIVAGNEGNWFSLNKSTGIIILVQTLDKEAQDTYTLIIKASSNESYVPSDVFTSAFDPGTDPTLKEVVIAITDQNDNPPIFPREFTAGVLSTYSKSHQVVDVAALDADTDPANIVMEYAIVKQSLCNSKLCEDLGVNRAFGIDSNGTTIYTVRNFVTAEQGWFELNVTVWDPSTTKPNEFFDSTIVDIYLITDRQQVRIDFTVPTETVSEFWEDFRLDLASIIEAFLLIGNNEEFAAVAVNLDEEQVHEDSDLWSYVKVHAIDTTTNRVIEAKLVEDAVDEAPKEQKNLLLETYNVFNVVEVYQEPEPIFTQTQWIFLGIALGCILLLVLTIIASCFTRNDYKRKLRAATAGMQSSKGEAVNKTIVPGTNKYSGEASNPVFNEKPPKYEEEEMETHSTEDAESAGGSEDQEFTVNIYDELDGESTTTSEEAGNSSKLLLGLLEELEKPDDKQGYDNVDVTDV